MDPTRLSDVQVEDINYSDSDLMCIKNHSYTENVEIHILLLLAFEHNREFPKLGAIKHVDELDFV